MALQQENRWKARPRAAAILRGLVYVGPFLVAVVSSALARRGVLTVAPEAPAVLVVAGTLPVALLALAASGRILRALLPLALLLRLSLLFPDEMPTRFGVALRSASPKRLARRLESDDENEAGVAENVLALVAALNAHDRRTRGHSERVRAMTMLLADELDLEPGERDRLEWAALLHDLGKMDVPPEILNKRGRPSDEEWHILRLHPASGPAHAAGLAGWLGDWIHAMDQHHERYDGTGYPQGLRGEEIARSGRIVAVSDAFEVMTATRSYKRPMSVEAARTELVACSGSHFDPVVVRAFMAVSVGDLHRALGPLSWLTSLPVFGPAGSGLGAAVGNAVLGGSVSPALAAALAIVALTPAAAGSPPAAEVPGGPAPVAVDAAPASIEELPAQPDVRPTTDDPDPIVDGLTPRQDQLDPSVVDGDIVDPLDVSETIRTVDETVSTVVGTVDRTARTLGPTTSGLVDDPADAIDGIVADAGPAAVAGVLDGAVGDVLEPLDEPLAAGQAPADSPDGEEPAADSTDAAGSLIERLLGDG